MAFFKKVFIKFSILIVIILSIFTSSLVINPDIQSMVKNLPPDQSIVSIPEKLDKKTLENDDKNRSVDFDKTSTAKRDFKKYAFYVPWDPNAWAELSELKYINKIDVLIPQWYYLDSTLTLRSTKDLKVDQLAKKIK